MPARTGPENSLSPRIDPPPARVGADKVAAILLALDRDRASRLLRHFDHDELRIVARAAVDLGALGPPDVGSIFEEFTARWTLGADLRGNAEEARKLFAESLAPAEAEEILAEALGGSDASIWTRLRQAPAASVAAMISRERRGVGAYVLSNLDAGFAASVIAEFPLETRANMLSLMLTAPEIAEPVKLVVEASLKNGFLRKQDGSKNSGMFSKVADIVNSYEAGEMEAIMKSIEIAKPKEGQQLRKMLFSFEDVDKLSRQSLSLLFDKLNTETVVLALRGTAAEFRDTVLSCLASRARRLVESELNNAAQVSRAEIARARKTIAGLVLRMAARNEIELPSTGGGDAANDGSPRT